jgi:hypothetical protein
MKPLEIQAEKASEIYLRNTALRALITSIPHIGGPLDIIFNSKGNKIIQKRITFLLENLKKEFNLLKVEFINKDFLDSEEFFDLIIKAIDASSRTASRNKILYYSRILKGSILNHNREQYYPDDYLNILIELTPRELDIAKIIYEKEDDILSDNVIYEERVSKYCPSVPQEDMDFIFIRLMRVGLLRPTSGWGGGVNYIITDVFRKIMEYLKNQ